MGEKLIKTKSICLVEGKDEINFCKSLLEHLNIKDVCCVDIGGNRSFNIKFKTKILVDDGFKNIEKIAIIRDAETNIAQSAFDSIKSALSVQDERNKLKDIISQCSLENNIVHNNNIKCGIFIMPNNKTQGMLEDLCLKYVEQLPVNICISHFIDCLKQNVFCNKSIENINISKSKLLSYLASLTTKKDNPTSLGIAALQGHFDFNNDVFKNITNFLKQVFL